MPRTNPNAAPCVIDGCERPQHGRGWCILHYNRWIVRGTTDDPIGQTLDERFWSKVDKTGECWVWTANKKADGYGMIRVAGRTVAAHRLSWELHFGPIPPDLHVCHTCDNPPCVNPDHLFVGTREDNMRDAAAKGRNVQQKKTHCPHGHEYTPENTYIVRRATGSTHRVCAACNAATYLRRKSNADR